MQQFRKPGIAAFVGQILNVSHRKESLPITSHQDSVAPVSIDTGYTFLFFVSVILITAATLIPQRISFNANSANVSVDNSVAATEEEFFRPAIRSIFLNEDDDKLGILASDGSHQLRQASSGDPLSTFRSSGRYLRGLQIGGINDLYAGINSDCELEIYRQQKLIWRGMLPDQTADEVPMYCSFTRDQRTLAVASKTGAIWLVDIRDRTVQPRARQLLGQSLTSATISPLGDRVLCIMADRTICIWNAVTARRETSITGQQFDAVFGQWSPRGDNFITFGIGRSLFVWSVSTGELIRELTVDSKCIVSATLSFDGKFAAVGDATMIRIWNVETGDEFCRFEDTESLISALRFDSAGDTLYSGDIKGAISCWNIPEAIERWSVW